MAVAPHELDPALVACRQRLWVLPTMRFWRHREHLALAWPLQAVAFLPVFGMFQSVGLLLGVLGGVAWDQFFVAACMSYVAALSAWVVSLGLVERLVRHLARRRRAIEEASRQPELQPNARASAVCAAK